MAKITKALLFEFSSWMVLVLLYSYGKDHRRNCQKISYNHPKSSVILGNSELALCQITWLARIILGVQHLTYWVVSYALCLQASQNAAWTQHSNRF